MMNGQVGMREVTTCDLANFREMFLKQDIRGLPDMDAGAHRIATGMAKVYDRE
jgi:hypothetical protein